MWRARRTDPVFADRADAGRRLGAHLAELARWTGDVVVLGLPRGGVPVAAEVARALAAPLDVVVVRKLGVPTQPELAMGAIAEHGVRVLDESVLAHAHLGPEGLARVEAHERAELERRVESIRGTRPPESLEDRVAVVVDDGLATGSTAQAACVAARRRGARLVVVAVPVGPRGIATRLTEADTTICLASPVSFGAVGRFYDDFAPVSDDEVLSRLAEHRRGPD
jgi:putative phosphoribosyl transferase